MSVDQAQIIGLNSASLIQINDKLSYKRLTVYSALGRAAALAGGTFMLHRVCP